MTAEPDPAIPGHLADVDQRIADLNRKLDRGGKALIRADVVFICAVLALAVIEVAAQPTVPRWELVAWMLIAAGLAAGGIFSQRMIGNLREEIRYLRSRP